jgi:hypothetical protein
VSGWLNGNDVPRRERGERGFADVDWWNGDTYLAGVIGTMALRHRDSGTGYPQAMTVEEWKDTLTKIGEPLVAYADGKFEAADVDAERVLAENARGALILFARHFTHFWD